MSEKEKRPVRLENNEGDEEIAEVQQQGLAEASL